MSTIQRKLPVSVEGRIMALNTAKNKEATLPVGTIIISAATKARMLAIQTSYTAAELALRTAIAVSTGTTSTKNGSQAIARMWSSHYYQALNNAIDRAVYPPEVRGYFSLPVSSGAVPVMDTEEKVSLWGGRVTSGEAAMVLAGHAAVAFPTEPDVKATVVAYNTDLTVQSTAKTATDSAQEALDGLNEEADKVIKKIWDEVETFYNEEPAESMRANAREWGVKYITLGNPTQILFVAKRADTLEGIEATVFKFTSTGVTHTAGPEGTTDVETRLVGEEPVLATHPEYVSLTQNITIVEGVGMTVTFMMVAM